MKSCHRLRVSEVLVSISARCPDICNCLIANAVGAWREMKQSAHTHQGEARCCLRSHLHRSAILELGPIRSRAGAAGVQIEVKEGTRGRKTRLVKPLLERPRRNMPPVEAQRFTEERIHRRHTKSRNAVPGTS